MLNAHDAVFGSKRSDICAHAVYFLHSTMSSVTCLRVSDVSVICRVTYLQFPIQACFCSTLVSQAAQRRTWFTRYRTSPKIWRCLLYGTYRLGEWLWINSNGKMETGIPYRIQRSFGSEFPSIYNQSWVMDAWSRKTLKFFCVFLKNDPLYGQVFKIMFRKFLSPRRSTCYV